ncbi:hypothetical protein ILUMI_00099 [Ignelater luminosus]|uniref:DDE-1 domain-containing protein n=1 Tax=Ignelater luminosus TaxID=2038154 RepID=A0A8K0GLK7_IGNLU|nr:hypothetical protein ILUMI_00099 [Ignelater luminosus]
MVFPRVHFKAHMLRGALRGTIGLANPSGWMNFSQFVSVMEHFIRETFSIKENATLLIMDNHESHISLDVINLARENEVIIVTMPLHCSHCLQPFDVAVYGLLETHCNTSVDQWIKDYSGTPMSIYDISGCFGVAFERAMTPTNILASFRRTGIAPVNTTAEVELMSATAQSSSTNKKSKKLDENTDFISPKKFIGYPKAKSWKESPNKRKRVLSCILADTPQKADLERREEEKKSKKIKKPKLDVDLPFSFSEKSELEMSDH